CDGRGACAACQELPTMHGSPPNLRKASLAWWAAMLKASGQSIEVRDPVEREPEHQLAAARRPFERLFGVRQRLAGAHHAPQDVVEPFARGLARAVEPRARRDLPLARR